MNPLMIMQLASTGLSLFGSVADAGRAKNQTKLNNMVADVNAAKETTNTMRSYTAAMEEMTSRMKAQKAVFANAGIDTASTLFSRGMAAHEKSFLEAKTGQNEALTEIQGGLKLTKAQNKYNLGATYKQLGASIAMNLANSFMDYKMMNAMYGGTKTASGANSETKLNLKGYTAPNFTGNNLDLIDTNLSYGAYVPKKSYLSLNNKWGGK